MKKLGILKGITLYLEKDGQEISLQNASSGELLLLSTLTFISSYIKRNSIILIDEPENSLHPKWQKDYISLLLKVLTDYFKDDFKFFNIACATHSPFILSDIPKENVIFLEKDKESGLCKNVSKNIKLKTFGANIHTLL